MRFKIGIEQACKEKNDGLVQDSGHGQFLDTAVGELDQAAGVVREPKVLFVAPIALGRHGVAQEGVEGVLGGRCWRHSLAFSLIWTRAECSAVRAGGSATACST